MMEFIRWRDEVLRQVRFKPDRKAIREELNGHYEDKVADLERLGYDRKLAESRALEAMGDAREIGKAFDRVHKPWLGWLWKITTWVAVVLVLVTVWNGWIARGYIEIQNRLGLMPDVVDYQADGENFAISHDDPTVTRVFWRPVNQKVERAGATIELPYMAVWEDTFVDGKQYWLEFVITEKDYRFWEEGPDLTELVMENSAGTTYRYSGKYDARKEEKPFMMSREETLFGAVYQVTLNLGLEPQEWLELTYPHGDPWTFRLDWEEADLK